MLKINEEIEVTIEKIVFKGEGMAIYNGMVIFVPLSCIGDKLLIQIISIKKTYARGLIKKILVPSADRAFTDKISFRDYNACDFAMLKYEKQLEYKDKMLTELFSSMGKIDIHPLYDGIIGANQIYNYRNKVAEPFFIENGEIKTGLYDRKSHDIFSSTEDLLKSNIASKVTEIVLKEINKSNFTVYDESKDKGFLKHLLIRNNQNNDVMLGIVVNKKGEMKKLENVLKIIYEKCEEIKSIYVSVKYNKDNTIIGREINHIIGEKYITENIFDITFKIYLDSFFQIDIEQVKKLYSKALSFIKENGKMAIDAFSGTGTIAMLMSKKFEKIYAIEYTKSAVIAAKKSAKENEINNIKFINSKVEDKIENIVKYEPVEYIVFDPPRKGVDKKVLDEIIKNDIKNIVYISCEPSTFVRDFNILKDNGYKLEKISAVDMFPNTHHIETVALITKCMEF